jgi:glycosyltransferase involved in cell wall biosynthesis
MRVLRVYHSAVVTEYRERERLLTRNHGHEVHLVCPPAWNEGGNVVEACKDSEIPVHIVPRRGREHPILFWYASREFRRVLRELRPHVVDLHEEPYSLAVAAALRAVEAEVPEAAVCVYTAQNIFKQFPPPFKQMERRALARAAALYPCSTDAGEVARRKGYRGEIHVIPLGVSIPEDCGGRRRPPHVAFVGRLEDYKGGMVALDAFASVRRHVEAVFEVVGAGSQQTELEERARALDIADSVRFTGALDQEETLRRMSEYEVVVVPSLTTPSWKEQFGRVPAQAMAAGTAVIASDSGSLAEVVGDAGVLVPENNVAALSGALAALLSDDDRRRAVAAAGRARAIERFAWARVAATFDEMYAHAVRTEGDV